MPAFLHRYRQSLPLERCMLLDRFSPVGIVKKVAGVGSVSSRCLIVLLKAEDGTPLYLQFKQAASPFSKSISGPAPASRQFNDGVIEVVRDI